MNPVVWQCRGRRFEIGPRPLVMGIVNVTPDSFSDGGRFSEPTAAIDHGLRLAAEGADLLDIGGESTRPGSESVDLHEELRRVVPVVAGLAKRTSVPISVDTMKAEVARRCLDAGAAVVNDVTGLRGDPDMPAVCAAAGAGIVVMHMQGTPQTMQHDPKYHDVADEVAEFFRARRDALVAAGINLASIAVDPGIGFGKTLDHNLTLLANLSAFRGLGRPLCLGVSRKGLIGQVTGRSRDERIAGTLAINCFAVAANSAHILRVHDVAPTRDAALLYDAIAHHRTPSSDPRE